MAREGPGATRASSANAFTVLGHNSKSLLNSDFAANTDNTSCGELHNSLREEEGVWRPGFFGIILLCPNTIKPPPPRINTPSIAATFASIRQTCSHFLASSIPSLHPHSTTISRIKMARIKRVPTISPPKPPKSNSSSPGSDSSYPPKPLGTTDYAKLEAKWEAKARRHDQLLQKPKRNHSYIRSNGEAVASDGRFDVVSQSPRKINRRRHPKVAAAKDNGTLTSRLEEYYQGFQLGQHKGKATWQHIPLAGFCRAEVASVPEVRVSQLPSHNVLATLTAPLCFFRAIKHAQVSLTRLCFRRMHSTQDRPSSSMCLIT